MNIAQIEALLDQPSPPKVLQNAVVIYGAGNFGRKVLRVLREHGRTVPAFIDQRTGLAPIDGVPVMSLAEFSQNYHPTDYAVTVAVHSDCNFVKLFNILENHSFKYVLTPFDLVKIFPILSDSTYWLSNCKISKHGTDIIAASEIWQTAEDIEHFLRLVSFRITGDYASLPPPLLQDQYTPKGLPRWHEPMRLIDAGAYDGDTLKHFAAQGYDLQAALCFEPDPANFRLLQQLTAGQESVLCMQKGLGERIEQLRFDCRNGMGSTIDEAGDTVIDITTIDAIAADFAPTLIKMDIEGAEQAALRGAEAVIRFYRPDLAISLYHCPEDLWAIPLWVQRLNMGYRLHLRTHRHSSFDTVLYAYAQ